MCYIGLDWIGLDYAGIKPACVSPEGMGTDFVSNGTTYSLCVPYFRRLVRHLGRKNWGCQGLSAPKWRKASLPLVFSLSAELSLPVKVPVPLLW
jgi:hypothetical protein